MTFKYKHALLFSVAISVGTLLYITTIYQPAVKILKEKSLTEFSNEVKIRNYLINSVANRIVDGAKSMSSRTMIRKKIVEYYDNQTTFDNLRQYTAPKYKDGIDALINCSYASRIVRSGLLVEYKTNDCKENYMVNISDTSFRKLITHIERKDTLLKVSVVSPIEHQNQILGYDFLFSLEPNVISKAEKHNYKFTVIPYDLAKNDSLFEDGETISKIVESVGTDLSHKFSIEKSELFKELYNYENRQIAFIILFITIITLAYFTIRQRARIYYFEKGKYLEKMVKEKTEELNNTIEELQTKNEELHNSENQLRIANQTKDKLFSIIAHDLKGPLSGLVSLFDILLSRNPDKEKQERYLKTARKTAENTHHLIENLLTWARSQSNHIRYNPEAINLEKDAAQIIDQLSQQAALKNINVINNVDKTHIAKADSNMLKIIMRNLISNALKFTQNGGKIEISSHKSKKGFITIEVADNGIGISEEIAANLFHSNNHSSTKGTQNEQGTGLGLLLCREFIERHGGNLSIESYQGQGSTFKFTIPTQ
jgi:signal transduction histidine kinase